MLFVLLLVALGVVAQFSFGLAQTSRLPAVSKLNGEATAFTFDMWKPVLSGRISLKVLGATLSMPACVALVIILVLFLAVFVRRLGEARVVAGAILAVPFLALPTGTDLLRLAEWTSTSPDLRLFFKSVTLATTAGAAATLVALPVAFFLALGGTKRQGFWLAVVLLPFLTSFLLRVFAWRVLLGGNGVVSSALSELGLASAGDPPSWLGYSPLAVVIVLVYAWTPFIVVPMYLAFRGIDPDALEAARDLGATGRRTLVEVVAPLALPGIAAGFLLVFIPSLGEYVVPTLVGGPTGFMYGQSIAQAFVGGTLAWQHGAVLALFLVLVVLVIAARAAPVLRSGTEAPGTARPPDSNLVVSRGVRHVLRAFFSAFLLFLYAPTLMLIVFSFNDSPSPSLPLRGFTLHWYHVAFSNHDLLNALSLSAQVAVLVGILSTIIGSLLSYGIARGRVPFSNAMSALALLPMVAPPVVLGVAFLLLFQRGPVHVPLGIPAVVLAHLVITLPFSVLVLLPAFRAIDPAVDEAAKDLGAGWARTASEVIVPLAMPAILAAFLICFIVSFDEVVVAGFLVSDRPTFPVYLYSGLRFSARLMPLVAVATVLIVASAAVATAAEVLRGRAAHRVVDAAD
jgi:spermidine/putrescine transport system permease protein